MEKELRTIADLAPVWDRFREGDVVLCPKEDGPMALAVDAAAGAYRFVCTCCGHASPWFESGPGGMRVRGGVGYGAGSQVSED